MNSHNDKLTKWAAAAEIWQLTQTDLSEEEWAKYRGRCRPLHVQYKPLVDKRGTHQPKQSEQAEHWWAATVHAFRDLQHLGLEHTSTVKFLAACGQDIANKPDLVLGGGSEALAWQVGLMLPHDIWSEI